MAADDTAPGISRRSFLKGAGGAAAVGGMAGVVEAAATREVQSGPIRGTVEIVLRVNGEERPVKVEPRTTLLRALRERMLPALTGAKEVCDRGNCGACTVLIDGEISCACLVLALDARGMEITTVEGLGGPDNLSPVQDALWKNDGVMCGFCTPGFAVALSACLDEDPGADEAAVRRALSGNLCRCGTQPRILDAARGLAAQAKMEEGR